MLFLNNLVRFIIENRIIENLLILLMVFRIMENNLKITSLKEKINKNHIEIIGHLENLYTRVDILEYKDTIYKNNNDVHQMLITKRLNKISSELTINTNIQNEVFEIIYNDITPLIKNVCNKSCIIKEPLASNEPLFPINENNNTNIPIPANTYASYIKYAPYAPYAQIHTIPTKLNKTENKEENVKEDQKSKLSEMNVDVAFNELDVAFNELDVAFNEYVEELREIIKIYNISFEDYIITNDSNITV